MDLLTIASVNSHRYRLQMHTFGCKVNTYDSGLLEARLKKTGAELSAKADLPLVHLLNTCAVTAEATREAKKLVRRLKARDPLSRVVVTGCGAQVDTSDFENLPGVDLVVANSHKGQLENLLDMHFRGALTSKVFRSNIFLKDDLESGGGIESEHTRSFLKIQDGCNSFCSYCVIPFARGRSRSIPIADLVRRVGELTRAGVAEVVLTGVHIGDYLDSSTATRERGPAAHGHDHTSARLSDLIEAILGETSLPRLRLTSLEPIELSPELLKLFENPRLCPHFHMSIQSASDSVLRGMRRKYGASEVEQSLRQISGRISNAFVGIDLITGFPGESEENFLETYRRLERLPWTRLHVFPYSERPGTKAIEHEDIVPGSVRRARAARLRELSQLRFREVATGQIGQIKNALVIAGGDAALVRGLTRDYWPVEWPQELSLAVGGKVGTERQVRITGFRQGPDTRMEGILRAEVCV